MSDAGHPSRHGFRRCARCGCWRRAEGVQPLHWADGTAAEGDVWACSDAAVCGRMAGAGEAHATTRSYYRRLPATPHESFLRDSVQRLCMTPGDGTQSDDVEVVTCEACRSLLRANAGRLDADTGDV